MCRWQFANSRKKRFFARNIPEGQVFAQYAISAFISEAKVKVPSCRW